MHLAQTRIVLVRPSTTALTFCRLGRNVLRETPVTRLPTPPFFLASPRRLILLPVEGPFPQISQTLDIMKYFLVFVEARIQNTLG